MMFNPIVVSSQMVGRPEGAIEGVWVKKDWVTTNCSLCEMPHTF